MKKRVSVLLVVVLVMLCLAGCGSEAIEIIDVKYGGQELLNITYKANKEIAADDCLMRVTISKKGDTFDGTVYREAKPKNDLKKGQQYLNLYSCAGLVAWTVKGTLKHDAQTANEGDTFMKQNILSELGAGTEVTVSFIIDGETVATKTITIE